MCLVRHASQRLRLRLLGLVAHARDDAHRFLKVLGDDEMDAPADRIAKRISNEESHARDDALDLLRSAPADRRVKAREDLRNPPADRIATRT